MRTTKFRAWDDEINHMYYPPNSHIAMWCDGGCINLQTGKKLIPLFWTGLSDRNGKKIWEGDIINIHNNYATDDSIDSIAKVFFKDGAFQTDFYDALIRIAKPGNWLVEVIGNIYEKVENEEVSVD